MLQVARLAPRALGDAALRVREFLDAQFLDTGGARDRAGAPDLYYTVFALEGLIALQAELPVGPTAAWLDGFGDGDGLDLVHLACLARCWSAMPKGALTDARRRAIARRLERFRRDDGGYAGDAGSDADAAVADSAGDTGGDGSSPAAGTVYHSFLAFAAHQDLRTEPTDAERIADAVEGLRAADGAWANRRGLAVGSTTVTAAAVTLLRQLRRPIPDGVGAWLFARAHPGGGFLAAPRAPLPDLLSTATALHALASLQVDFSSVREPCLDFVDSLWTGRAFCGHWADDFQDSEYTYYALLALGHLSL